MPFTYIRPHDILCLCISEDSQQSQLHPSPDTSFNVPSFSGSYSITTSVTASSKQSYSSSNTASTSRSKAPSTGAVTVRGTAAAGGDHDFVLPLHSSVTLDDQLSSSDGLVA